MIHDPYYGQQRARVGFSISSNFSITSRTNPLELFRLQRDSSPEVVLEGKVAMPIYHHKLHLAGTEPLSSASTNTSTWRARAPMLPF
jgi:hypothetical protein